MRAVMGIGARLATPPPVVQPAPAPPPPVVSGYSPTVTWDYMSPWSQGAYYTDLRGYIIHGSRSGVDANDAVSEFWGTARFTKNRTDQLGYQATIGPDLVSMGVNWGEWAWHARACSEHYVGFELAQSLESHPIDNATVRALCWAIQQDQAYRRAHHLPLTPLTFKTHAMVDGTAEYGGFLDGKSDVFSKGSPAWDELLSRIQARLKVIGVF